MLLTLSTSEPPASDLGYLLHKHPGRLQSFPLSFGKAHVFYPEATEERTTACLLLEVDSLGLARGRADRGFLLAPYVNDRPYVASSFLGTAIAEVYGTALQGRSRERPEAARRPRELLARIEVLPVRGGGEGLLERLFEPLGYRIESVRHPLDTRFPGWGPSPYHSVTLRHRLTLAELLGHLYVLMPVFDDRKHYFVGEDEIAKLLRRGEGWLAAHPARDEITRRYLRHQPSLYQEALDRLAGDEGTGAPGEDRGPEDWRDLAARKPASLEAERLGAVVAALRASGARRVLDLGCGDGKLLALLLAEPAFEAVTGVDVSQASLAAAERRLGRVPGRERLTLLHGSLVYRDGRLRGHDAAALVEVVEHLEPGRLPALEEVVFADARPRTVVVTTPNREYNVRWAALGQGALRHADHRFEWSRDELRAWALAVGGRHGYSVRLSGIGQADGSLGPPTQMALFERREPAP